MVKFKDKLKKATLTTMLTVLGTVGVLGQSKSFNSSSLVGMINPNEKYETVQDSINTVKLYEDYVRNGTEAKITKAYKEVVRKNINMKYDRFRNDQYNDGKGYPKSEVINYIKNTVGPEVANLLNNNKMMETLFEYILENPNDISVKHFKDSKNRVDGNYGTQYDDVIQNASAVHLSKPYKNNVFNAMLIYNEKDIKRGGDVEVVYVPCPNNKFKVIDPSLVDMPKNPVVDSTKNNLEKKIIKVEESEKSKTISWYNALRLSGQDSTNYVGLNSGIEADLSKSLATYFGVNANVGKGVSELGFNGGLDFKINPSGNVSFSIIPNFAFFKDFKSENESTYTALGVDFGAKIKTGDNQSLVIQPFYTSYRDNLGNKYNEFGGIVAYNLTKNLAINASVSNLNKQNMYNLGFTFNLFDGRKSNKHLNYKATSSKLSNNDNFGTPNNGDNNNGNIFGN